MKKEIIYAFPNERDEPNKGMDLRDYFAAKAIAGIISGEYFGMSSDISYAEAAYRISDAMLEARKQVKTK